MNVNIINLFVQLDILCSRLWKMKEYCKQKHGEYEAKGHKFMPCSPITTLDTLPEQILEFRKSFYKESDIVFALMQFKRKYFGTDTLPKVLLHKYAGQNKVSLPTYETKREDRLYYSVVTFMGKKYSSLMWNRQEKHAEQNAALVCVYHLGLFDEHFLIAIGCLLERIPMDEKALKDVL